MKAVFAPRRIVSLLLAALLLLPLLSLTGCGRKLTESADGVIDKKNDRKYVHASVAYKPVAMGKSYGKLQVGSALTYELFTIEGLSPDEWLATEDGDVLYAEGVTLPTLTQMAPGAVLVCSGDTASLHVLRRISDETLVRELCDAVTNGVTEGFPAVSPRLVYTLRFESAAYSALYYEIAYVEYDEPLMLDDRELGKCFLYDAFDRIFVPVSDALHNALGLAD